MMSYIALWSQTGTHIVALLLLALGLIGLTRVSFEAENLRSALLLVYAIFCGYIYQVPKAWNFGKIFETRFSNEF